MLNKQKRQISTLEKGQNLAFRGYSERGPEKHQNIEVLEGLVFRFSLVFIVFFTRFFSSAKKSRKRKIPGVENHTFLPLHVTV